MKIRFITTLSLLLFLTPVFAQAPGGGGPAGGGGQPAAGGGGGQPPAGGAGTPANPKKKGNQNYLELRILENFEESEDWNARSTCPLGITKLMKVVQRGPIVSADDPNEKPNEGEECDVNEPKCEKEPNHIMGVKTYFQDRGFDRVEVRPPHEYVIKGKARQFSIWILGRKYRHTFSIKLKDYKGKIHKLSLGRLDFFGWRKLTVTVPGYLPQSTRYALIDKNLRFVSFFVTSDVHEVPGTFYFYVDGLKVLIDKSEMDYPGSEIKDNW